VPGDTRRPARRIDLRPDDDPPFEAVVAAVGELDAGDVVEVVAGTVPFTLLDAFERRDWPYEAVRVTRGEWRVRVTPGEAAVSPAVADHRSVRPDRSETERRSPTPSHRT
jgi:uncharacterized protein (DUF2249 family)